MSAADLTPGSADEREAVLALVRRLGGWVAAEGIAPVAVLEAMTAEGLLEQWPGVRMWRAG